MKIAMVDPLSLENGLLTWERMIVDALGCDFYYVSKPPSFRGQSIGYRVLPKDIYNAASILNGYDLIILTAMSTAKSKEPHPYVQIFGQVLAPWIVVLHGNHYKNVHHLDMLFSSAGYMNTVLSSHVSHYQAFIGHHPYRPRCIEISDFPYIPIITGHGIASPDGPIVMTSRIEANKGIYPVILAADALDRDIHLPSYSTELRFGSYSWGLYCKLKNIGYQLSDVRPYGTAPWSGISPRGNHIYYDGGFTDLYTVLNGASVHVNFTSPRFCVGRLEYVTLEAMDLGIPVVVPAQQLSEKYDDIVGVDGYQYPTKYDPYQLIAGIRNAMKLGSTTEKSEALTLSYRDQLRQYHSPHGYVQDLFRALDLGVL